MATARKSRHADNGRKKKRARKSHSHLEVVSKKGTRYARGPKGEWVKTTKKGCGCQHAIEAKKPRRKAKRRKVASR